MCVGAAVNNSSTLIDVAFDRSSVVCLDGVWNLYMYK